MPAEAFAPDGSLVMVWTSDGQDGDSGGIFVRRFNASGLPIGTEDQVNTYTSGVQTNASVAVDGAGNFVIAWDSFSLPVSQDGSLHGVYAQRFNAQGNPLGQEFRVNTYTFNPQSKPSIAMNAAGDFVIAWQSNGQDADGSSGVYAQRYDAAGAKQGTEFRINNFTTGQQTEPRAAMDASGGFVVVWNGVGPADDSGVFGRRFDPSGQPLGDDFMMNTYTTSYQDRVDLAMDPLTGDFMAAWYSLQVPTTTTPDVIARRFDAAGNPQGPELLISTPSDLSGSQDPRVAMNASGQAIVTWRQSFDIHGQRFDASGNRVGGQMQINTSGISDYNGDVAMDGQGGFVASWSASSQFTSSDVYARRYNYAQADGTPHVINSSFIYAQKPMSLQFVFDRDVSPSVRADDLLLQNLTDGTTVPASSMLASWNSANFSDTFTFPALPNGGALPNGLYRATLMGSGVNNKDGVPMAADYVTSFFFVNGDANHDGTVDVSDLGIVASNWQATNRTYPKGDFNYDGKVDATDLGILATNWQYKLPSTTLLAATARLPQRRIKDSTESLAVSILD